MKLRLIALFAVVAAALVVAGCGGADDSTNGSGSNGGSGSTTLSLVAFSTPEVVYDELIPDFQKTDAGKDVKFKTSYGASGEQSRAVAAGLKTDVVNLSLAPDVSKLVDAGLVPADWDKGQYKGFVTNSVVSFIVRKGNPKHIKTWDDLIKPGVKVVTPNPFTSGAAKWNLLGGYQHGGLNYVKQLIAHTSVQPK
jgi:ABC-type sulfate transport system substrate-binding protein